ncbi:MAG: TlpA disulfide reductase family protein [Actinomycetota bacterium]|nr:TlpA disulfide reductase family protein [Actinomycetota bacterium]
MDKGQNPQDLSLVLLLSPAARILKASLKTKALKTGYLALLIVLCAALFSCQKQHLPLQTGKPAPGFTVMDASGQKVTLSSLKGNVVLVNFWATWCGVCQEETPSLNGLYNKLKANPHFRMISIPFKDSTGAARQYLKDNSSSIPVYEDPGGKAALDYGLTGVPETYIVDKSGILRQKVIGGMNWSDPRVLSYMQGLLSK